MDKRQRKSLAEQITTNPLFNEVLDEMERRATERLIYAKDDDISPAQHRVQAIRTFRTDLERELQDTRPRKGAPA